MRIAITGATGLLGGALRDHLQRDGHEVVGVTRSRDRAAAHDVVWDPPAGTIDAAGLEGLDGVVHLAGEPIGSSRWSADTKQRIRDSRTQGTDLLARTLAGLTTPPPVLLSASAVGYYGERGDDVITEAAGPGDDFLAGVCRDWEAAAQPAREAGIRVTHPRTGVVIAAGGPLIDKIELPFKLGVGGRIGTGRQYVPWISLTDHVRALRFLLEHDLAGPVNLTAPEPVTNAELTAAIGDVLRRPTVLPIPTPAITALYGEMGRTLASVSQRVRPAALLGAGFEFVHTEIRPALRLALQRPAA